MRIAYLSGSIFPSKAANGVHVIRMCEAFSKAGHKVTLFAFQETGKTPNIIENYGIGYTFETKFVFIKKECPWRNRLATVLLALKLKVGDFDLLYSRHLISAFIAARKKPFIFETHAFPTTFRRRLLEKILLKRKNLLALVSITQSLSLKYIHEYKFPPDKILVAADGASEAPCVDITNHCDTVGYIGHLYEGRGIEIVIELATAFPSLKFVIIGGEEEHVEHWKTYCSEINNISFKGYVPHSMLKEYYQNIDIVLAPYQEVVRVSGNRGDTSKWMSPLKIFEYMSYQKPIIASDLPALREVLRDEETCLLCKPDDLNSWRTKLQKLIDNDELRQRLGRQAYEDFTENYTWDTRVKKLLDVATKKIK